MPFKKNLELVKKTLSNRSLTRKDKNEIHTYISRHFDQFFEISESCVAEVKKLKGRHPNRWKETVSITMFSTPWKNEKYL